ncbi:hypothetical protein BU23DRAFT_561689 [Bimuria novae-zelandiae CBS 107.79]|uniref:Uncharacterized protein n=1 Tax=Bimuria novae-zelandiae CBS 107.79 TaxID=1447943 RepID=A0A6A5UIZ2_9PLEO|nr:hypothetical protein BU23DRAFT_561689 [Bimuria novae-zelandiae CBS 107.79]
MFSGHDLVEIHEFLPPTTHDGFPLLIRTASGQSFVTERSLRRSFEHLVTTEPARISILIASNRLGVDTDVVLQLVQANATLALLSQDRSSIIPKQERDALVKDLEESLAKGFVAKYEVARSHDLHKDSLDDLLQVANIREGLAENTVDYVLGEAYEKELFKAIRQKLVDGMNDIETIKLKPHSLPGAPPLWLIQKCLDKIDHIATNKTDIASQYHIEQKDDVIYCTPKKLILNQRDKLLADLQAGNTFSLRLEDFLQTFSDLYQSSEALQTHLSGFPSITSIKCFAVSNVKLSGCVGEVRRILDDQGHVDLKAVLPSDAPREIAGDVLDHISREILSSTSADGKSLRRMGDYILTDRIYDSQRQALMDLTKTQAMCQWELLKEAADKEPKFQLAEILASFPDDAHLLRFLVRQKEFETASAEQFSTTVSDLESQNEQEFSAFWTERVPSRIQNYNEGLKAVIDAKLSDQLSDLLSDYLQKDFIPDMLSKARTQGLVCSRRTRKNVNRFEAALKASKTDPNSILLTVDKFSRKQGLPDPDLSAAEETKKMLIQDMVRRMQKPKTDAPLMFLSLVIVLFAKRNPGVVYATGRFAPKLLKQLKTQLSGEEHEQAEKWKELAKARKLEKEDREAMVRMAEQAS